MDLLDVGVETSIDRHLEDLDFLMGHNYAAYDVVMEEVDKDYARRMEVNAAVSSRARYVYMPICLGPEQRRQIADEYPEFRLSSVSFEMPPNSLWRAHRVLANEVACSHAADHGRKVIHWGGDAFSHLISGRTGFHCVCDTSDPLVLQEECVRRSRAARTFAECARFREEVGRAISNAEYAAYTANRQYTTCYDVDACDHRADVVVADLVGGLASPAQLAMGLVHCGARMCFGFFPYCDAMMLAENGTFAGLKVGFEFTPAGLMSRETICMKYYEGLSGATQMDAETFNLYCQDSYFEVLGEHFYLELMQVRGPFMHFKMTRTSIAPETAEFSHALYLSRPESYFVQSWRLRSVIADPAVESSWVADDFIVDRSLFKKAYDFGMSLTAEEFSRAAIRKRLVYFNDRITVRGTAVMVQEPLSPDQLDSFTTALFGRLFVDRYETSRLTSAVMDNLRKVNEFREAGFAKRVYLITRVTAESVLGFFFRGRLSALRVICDVISRYIDVNARVAHTVKIDIAPSFVTKSQLTNKFTQYFWRVAKAAVRVVLNPKNWIKPVVYLGLEVFTAVVVMHGYVSTTVATNLASRFVRYSIKDMYKALFEGCNVPFVLPAERIGPIPEHEYLTQTVDIGDENAVKTLTAYTPLEVDFIRGFHVLGDVLFAGVGMHGISAEVVVRSTDDEEELDFTVDTQFVETLNEVHRLTFPGVGLQRMEMDSANFSLFDQERTLDAPYMRLQQVNDLPRPRKVYLSRVKAINALKRQNTMQEVLSAVASRNLAAPQLALPQNEEVLIPAIWEEFLATMCVPEAKAKLLQYRGLPVQPDEVALIAWSRQVDAAKVQRVVDLMETRMSNLNDLPIDEYLLMIKADVKPPLSKKPLNERIEPQVIVYHDPQLSAAFSALFRVLVRRFLSLLKPNVHVNLLKDSRDISQFLTRVHNFENSELKYLENDFSKYDKSQNRFAFELEFYIFEQLGMNDGFLQAWHQGHVRCNLRSVQMGLALNVMYQRKSGDATTAFGNVMLNVMAVSYAYRGLQFDWAMFQGDDSLIATRSLPDPQWAMAVMSEVFNLTSKYYVTEAPYYLSCFVDFDVTRRKATMIPDPIKRAEKWSVAVPADDPKWEERYISNVDALRCYRTRSTVARLGKLVSIRYDVTQVDADRLPDAIATGISSINAFRSIYEPEEVIVGT